MFHAEIFVSFLRSTLLLTLTGLSLFRIAPRAVQEIHSWTDRILLSLLTGIAFYTLFFLLAQGLFSVPLNQITIWVVFLLTIAAGLGCDFYRKKHHRPTGFPESSQWENQKFGNSRSKKIIKEILIFLTLGLIFYLSLHIRIQNGLKYPDQLLDADPYRHHIRTEHLLQTGYIQKYDPYLVGEVPIFELQGCYLLAGVLGVSGPFSAWQLWQWGSQVFGALGVISLYLFAKLAFRPVLQQDLGTLSNRESFSSYLRAEDAATWLGLIAAALLGASPVHILRTNAGFSEAYAIPLLAPAMLFYLWAAQSRIWGDFVWFGIFFTALAFINPVPAVFVVPFFFVHAAYTFYKNRDRRWIIGLFISGSIFALCLAVWNWKYLATPLLTGATATSDAGTKGLLKSIGKAMTWKEKLDAGWKTFSSEVFRNLGFINIQGKFSAIVFGFFGILKTGWQRIYDLFVLLVAGFGSLLILRDPHQKLWRVNETTVFFFLSYIFFFFVLFMIPFGFISFTSKYYRYLLPISLSLSFMFAYFVWRAVLYLTPRQRLRKILLLASLGLALLINAEGRTWGEWVLNCTPEEYEAADWIKQHTQPQDFIIANWYTGDYLRSLTLRQVIISDYPRSEVKVAMDKFDLNIPILPKDPAKVIEYIQSHPGTYYLVTSKWGPWGKYENYPGFELVATFGKNQKTQARIFQIHPELENPIHESHDSSSPIIKAAPSSINDQPASSTPKAFSE